LEDRYAQNSILLACSSGTSASRHSFRQGGAERIARYDAKIGPLRLVAPRDKRPARWIRMLQTIKVVSVPPS